MKILLIAEHNHNTLAPATANALGAALQIGGEVHLLVAGKDCRGAAEAAARLSGISKVLLIDEVAYADFLAEPLAALITEIGKGYSHILVPATTFGKDFMPRVAALLDVMQISDIIAVSTPDTFIRPIYAGNALATVESTDPIKVITVRTTAFDAPGLQEPAPIEPLPLPALPETGKRFIELKVTPSERPELTNARIVIAGGRGLGSKEHFTLIERLADKLGAAVGASRAAVDAGYVPNDAQIGQTGKVVAPDLYIAIGISGAIQHLAGMKDSKVIVAINKDENAPIFEIADYGLVGDLFEILPQLEAALG